MRPRDNLFPEFLDTHSVPKQSSQCTCHAESSLYTLQERSVPTNFGGTFANKPRRNKGESGGKGKGKGKKGKGGGKGKDKLEGAGGPQGKAKTTSSGALVQPSFTVLDHSFMPWLLPRALASLSSFEQLLLPSAVASVQLRSIFMPIIPQLHIVALDLFLNLWILIYVDIDMWLLHL